MVSRTPLTDPTIPNATVIIVTEHTTPPRP